MPLSTAATPVPDDAQLLARALINAARALGIRQAELGNIVGRDRSTLLRAGVAPEGQSGQLALLLVRCYRSLYALVGGDSGHMQHWMHTRNHHTGGVPAEQVRSITGLVHLCDYLDAIRGKV